MNNKFSEKNRNARNLYLVILWSNTIVAITGIFSIKSLPRFIYTLSIILICITAAYTIYYLYMIISYKLFIIKTIKMFCIHVKRSRCKNRSVTIGDGIDFIDEKYFVPKIQISYSCVGDLYLNLETGYIYECIKSGTYSTARWILCNVYT